MKKLLSVLLLLMLVIAPSSIVFAENLTYFKISEMYGTDYFVSATNLVATEKSIDEIPTYISLNKEVKITARKNINIFYANKVDGVDKAERIMPIGKIYSNIDERIFSTNEREDYITRTTVPDDYYNKNVEFFIFNIPGNNITLSGAGEYIVSMCSAYDLLGETSGGYTEINESSLEKVRIKILDEKESMEYENHQKTPEKGILAEVTLSKIRSVNGGVSIYEAYNIEGRNYFKIRDICALLSRVSGGNWKGVDVTYDSTKNAILLTTGQSYKSVGTEYSDPDGLSKYATPTTSKVYLDGEEVYIKSYMINGSSYFQLADLGKTLNVSVSYDSKEDYITINPLFPF